MQDKEKERKVHYQVSFAKRSLHVQSNGAGTSKILKLLEDGVASSQKHRYKEK